MYFGFDSTFCLNNQLTVAMVLNVHPFGVINFIFYTFFGKLHMEESTNSH